MALTGNGTSEYIRTTSPLAAGLTRYTFHLFYRNAAIPGNALNDAIFSISDAGTYDVTLYWDHTATAQAIRHLNAGATTNIATFSTPLTADTWHGLGGRFDGSNVDAFLNGVVDGTAAGADPDATDTPTPCALAGAVGAAEFDNGTICEVALWNVALTTGEMLALGNGFSPLLVRPQSLLIYWPLIRDIVALAGGAVTSSGTTVADHAPMYYPGGQQSTYFLPFKEFSVYTSDTLTLTETGPYEPSHLRDTLTLTESLTLSNNFARTSDTLTLTEEYDVQTGYIASGRVRDRGM